MAMESGLAEPRGFLDEHLTTSFLSMPCLPEARRWSRKARTTDLLLFCSMILDLRSCLLVALALPSPTLYTVFAHRCECLQSRFPQKIKLCTINARARGFMSNFSTTLSVPFTLLGETSEGLCTLETRVQLQMLTPIELHLNDVETSTEQTQLVPLRVQ